MRVTPKTLYSDFEPIEKYLKDGAKAVLMAAAEKQYGAMYDLPFGTFFDCANGDFSHLGKLTNPTVLQVYWCKRFEEFTKEFAKVLKRLQVPQTPEEKQAVDAMMDITWGEAILVFAQKWFGLKSYKAAEKITVGEILIAKRAAYNQEMFARKLQKIQMRNLRRK